MELLPLRGFKSLRALNAFHTLLLGLKMLPQYLSEDYVKFYESFKARSEADKEKLIREAILFVELQEEEVEALLSFVTDINGVPFSKVNIKNLNPDELHDAIAKVCMGLGAIKISLLTEEEKKK